MLSAESTMNDSAHVGFDPVAFRQAMSRFASGVTIVTTEDADGTPHGFTASSFCSVSLDPPIVLVCLARTANCFPVFTGSRRFAVSILGSLQVDLAKRFASKNPDKFSAGGFVRTAGGATVLDEALAAVECETATQYVAGDHVILLGNVERVRLAAEGRPTVYFDRGFHTLGAPDCPHCAGGELPAPAAVSGRAGAAGSSTSARSA